MAKPEEFEIFIDRDGRIRLDFRGMEEGSYRRIVETLRETVGPVEEVELAAKDAPPPLVLESMRNRARAESERAPELENRAERDDSR